MRNKSIFGTQIVDTLYMLWYLKCREYVYVNVCVRRKSE